MARHRAAAVARGRKIHSMAQFHGTTGMASPHSAAAARQWKESTAKSEPMEGSDDEARSRRRGAIDLPESDT